MKVLLSAQSFGYGPASKLVTMAKILNKIYDNNLKLDFIGDDIALTYVLQNSRYFNKIMEYKGEYPRLNKYDFVINVMNPYFAIWAWMNRKKIITIDSLFWLWNWNDNEYKDVVEITEQLKSINTEKEAWAILKNMNPHLMQYFSHSLSTSSCIQTFSKDKNIKLDKFRKEVDFQELGPIIDISHKSENNRKNKVIITLSGLLSPLNRIKDAERYANLVLLILEDFINDLPPHIEIYLTTNPEIVLLIKPISDRVRLVSLNHSEFLDLLNESIVVFAPAGITTIYESLNYDVPMIFLPEQHYGHYKNYLRLLKTDQRVEELREIFPETLFNTRMKRKEKDIPNEETDVIKKLIKQNYNSPTSPMIIEMKEVVSNYGKLVLKDSFRRELLNKQKLQLEDEQKIIDEGTISLIIDNMLKINHEPKIPRNLKLGISSSLNSQSLGMLLAKNNINLFTLGVKDLDFSTIETFKKNGGLIFAYSEEVNSYEHDKNDHNIKSNIFNNIYFKKDYDEPNVLRLVRDTDIILISNIDTVSMLAITYALALRKKLIFFKNNQNFDKDINNLKNFIKDIDTKSLIIRNEEQLIATLNKFQKESYYKI